MKEYYTILSRHCEFIFSAVYTVQKLGFIEVFIHIVSRTYTNFAVSVVVPFARCAKIMPDHARRQ